MAIFNKTFGKFAAGFGVVVILVILFGLFGKDLKKSWERRAENKELDDFYSQVEKEQARLIEAYKNDTYGGTTPEETWGMFIDALKSGDTDLASKYFIVEKQEEMKKAFTAGRENGALDDFLKKDVPAIIGGDYYKDGETFEFYTGDINNGPGFVYLLTLNKYTNKWKIKDL